MASGHHTNLKFAMAAPYQYDEIRAADFQEIIKIVATRCQIFGLKCTKIDFGWGSAFAPDPAGAAYSATPDPLTGIKGTYF